jgi:DNA polymerase III delta subunit
MDYVPEEQVQQVAAGLKNFQQVRQLLEKICNLNRQLLRRRVKL